MDKLSDVFTFFSKFFQWYFIVMPWEQAVFIRMGKNHRLCYKGIYFKIPFIDVVYIQTTRRRMIEAPMQTVTTKDGHAITIKAGVSYKILDMFKLYNSLYHPENTILNIVMSNISQYVASNNLADLNPNKVQQSASFSGNETEWGLGDLEVVLNNYAHVKTYRLIQDHSGFYGEQLSMKHMDEKIS